MITLNTKNEVISDELDLEKGYVFDEKLDAIFEYILEAEKESHYETIRTYPNGGSDVVEIIDVPEQGYWKMTVNGEEKDWPFTVQGCWFKDKKNEWPYFIKRYVEYTEEELAEIEAIKEEGRKAQEKAEYLQSILESVPEMQEETDEAICALYEMVMELQERVM